MRHPLADTYRQGRQRLLDLGRSLGEDDGAVGSSACPDWSVKDIYAHLAGISTDILTGNTAEAATTAWADGHVVDRRERSLSGVLDEWAEAGPRVSELMESMGEVFPLELFLDQWTHEWDIRAALGARAEAEADLTTVEHYFDHIADRFATDERGRDLARLTVAVDDRTIIIGGAEGDGRLALSLFDFARVVMGRRSRAQLDAYERTIDDIEPYLPILVVWSINEFDVIDPVRR
ncbi:MAG: maleylpyruvate isomerase family mycothiol-dependent enzyme [Actinomycetota bacterium]